MGRRIVNPYGITSLKNILENYVQAKEDFAKEFNKLFTKVMWMNQLTPLDIEEVGMFDTLFHVGSRVEILVFCDRFEITTPPGASIIHKLLFIGDKEWKKNIIDEPVNVVQQVFSFYQSAKGRTEDEKLHQTMRHFFPQQSESPPPPEYWRYFRMAKKGLGLPYPEELEQLEEMLGNVTSHDRARKPEDGLTYEEIAAIAPTCVETVRKAIKNCSNYLEVGDYRLESIVPAAFEDERVMEHVLRRISQISLNNLHKNMQR